MAETPELGAPGRHPCARLTGARSGSQVARVAPPGFWPAIGAKRRSEVRVPDRPRTPAAPWFALAAALLAGCVGADGNPPPAAGEELTLGESLVARGQQHELETIRVPPPGDFIEHEGAGFAKVLCSAVFLTGLDFEGAQTWIGGFTSRHQYATLRP